MNPARTGPEPATWTLGRREGRNCRYCAYCGRDCLTDGLPFIHLTRLDDGPQLFACQCCLHRDCIHHRPIVIECERCHRPVARLTFGPTGVILLGGVTPENQMRGGISVPGNPKWRARIWDVSLGSGERHKVVCIGRRCRTVQIVTQPALQRAYIAARRDNRTVASTSDFG